jgi:phosphopantothenoylcysteine decarboxylase / phosphopantothenate---cysteine ligase
MLKNKKILIGVTGSIAAYKIPFLVRLLIKHGAEVKIIMTTAAMTFVSPLTLATLSKNEVLTELADDQNNWSNHVMLGRWADIMIIAPLSCNTLFKMSSGACDNLLQAVYLSATCPVVTAPAMDEDMWHHPSTKKNIDTLTSFGNHVISVNNGELASGLVGEGRMAEPAEVIEWLENYFANSTALSGKQILVTAGPTHEPIDPVRFIGNASSGKMGIALATELHNRGASVTLIIGPTSEAIPVSIECIRVKTAEEMYTACMSKFESMDWAIMCAAVADYTPVKVEDQKIKKQDDHLAIQLKKTKDILAALGSQKKQHQCVVGFALETSNEKAFALGKLSAKNADLIVLNSLNDRGAGFGHDTNKITIFDKKGQEYHFDTKSKKEVAIDIINTIINYTNE